MRKLISLVLAWMCILFLLACHTQEPEPIRTIEGNMKTYYEMSDGIWQADGNTYKYCLEITGRMNAAGKTIL